MKELRPGPHKMGKNAGTKIYGVKFEEHVKAFLDSLNLFDSNKAGGRKIVSVSGGVDSVALLEVLYRFYPELEVLHFNHGSRPLENKQEERFLKKLCKRLGVKLNVFHFNITLTSANFEKRARLKRQKIYRDFIKEGAVVFTAHHIDDSFEWSMMQSFKQSSLRGTLGIPVYSNGIIRPFMCVTKEHILKYAKLKGLLWHEDLSNQNTRFERNYFRQKIEQAILEKYPRSLKHYVSRQNELALSLNCHALSVMDSPLEDVLYIPPFKFQVREDIEGRFVFKSSYFFQEKNEIKNLIHLLSKEDRGEIDLEVRKLVASQEEIIKNPTLFPFKGPMSFSGGVEGYLIKDELCLYQREQKELYAQLDERAYLYLKNLKNMTQIPEVLRFDFFPFLAIDFKKQMKKSSRYVHPLMPKTCAWLKHSEISYSFSPLLSKKDQQILASAAVILDSSLKAF